ncbi:hypothetical protein ES703_123945 [subsurface metagenome]
MSKETRAQILNLSAAILMGKATDEQIKKITKLAIADDESEFLHQELVDCGHIIQAD